MTDEGFIKTRNRGKLRYTIFEQDKLKDAKCFDGMFDGLGDIDEELAMQNGGRRKK